MASSVAPTHMTSAPPRTPSQRRQPACRNSLKKRKPQRMPSRLLQFQRGNAMLRPMSRMAKMVMVLATAQRHPASKAQIIRCGARRTSARTEEVPRISAGTLQRARKTPTTMISEITMGERPMETSLVGASAAPSQAPAVKPERTPRSLEFAGARGVWRGGWRGSGWHVGLVNRVQKEQATDEHGDGNPEMDVAQDRDKSRRRFFHFVCPGRVVPARGLC